MPGGERARRADLAALGLVAVAVVDPPGAVVLVDADLADAETRRGVGLFRRHGTPPVHDLCTNRAPGGRIT